jgi:hypothetical protein
VIFSLLLRYSLSVSKKTLASSYSPPSLAARFSAL